MRFTGWSLKTSSYAGAASSGFVGTPIVIVVDSYIKTVVSRGKFMIKVAVIVLYGLLM
jgi:hypothetical protein